MSMTCVRRAALVTATALVLAGCGKTTLAGGGTTTSTAASGGSIAVVDAPSYTGALHSLSASCQLDDGDLYFSASSTTTAGASFDFNGYVKAASLAIGSVTFQAGSVVLDGMGGQQLNEPSNSGTVTVDMNSGSAELIFNNLASSSGTINGSMTCGVTTGTGATTSTTAGSSTTSSVAGGGQNLSGNDYFPLVVGAVWKYKVTSGPRAGAIYTTTVIGAHPADGGLAVQVQYTSSESNSTISAQYTVESNGSIEVQAGVSGSGTNMSFGGGGSYDIPDQAGIISCTPCDFTGNFTATVPNVPTAIQEKLTETVTSAGATSVTVSGNPYQTEVLNVQITDTGGAEGFTTTESSSYDLYLAENVGVVEIGGGTGSVTVEGQTESVPIGDEVLLSYTP